jgi:anti-sigma B factor antagonist
MHTNAEIFVVIPVSVGPIHTSRYRARTWPGRRGRHAEAFAVTQSETSRGTPALRLARLPADPAPVLVVTGEVDVYEAPTFRSELFGLLDEEHERIIVDCSGMNFIDSAGLAALVDAHRRAASRGGTIVLRGVRAASRRIFEITDLVNLFEFD